MSHHDRRSVDALLAAARAKLRRVDPHAAAAMVESGALLVDVRPREQRERDGEVPGALVIGRNVLEWRLDPASPHRIPEVHAYDQAIVVMCAEGYSSSFAAAALQDLGLTAATDLIGGFQAWNGAGLPTRPVRTWRVQLRRLRAKVPIGGDATVLRVPSFGSAGAHAPGVFAPMATT